MRRTTLLVSLAAIAAVVPAATEAAPSPKAHKTVITVKPTAIVFGQTATIAGKVGAVRAGVTVELQGQDAPYNGAFTVRKTAATTAHGSFAFTQVSSASTNYRVVAKASPVQTSNVVRLNVAWRVGLRVSTYTPHSGARVRFSGSVAPVHVGGRALLQKLTATGYHTVAQATLKAGTATSSRYTISIRVSSNGTYRVRVPGDFAHLAGTSRTRTLAAV